MTSAKLKTLFRRYVLYDIMKSVYADSCHCCFKVENLRKVAEQASTAAAGTLTHPEGISMAEWGVLVS